MTVDADTYGYTDITWTNASKDASWYSWRVYRRYATTGAWVLLKEYTVDQSTYDFHDWLFESGTTYDYAVVQVAWRFGSLIESSYVPQTVTPVSTHYWLIDDANEANNFRLYNVTDDSYDDEYEAEEVLLVGRGRHVNVGEHWGIKGSLTNEIRDQTYPSTLTARQQVLLYRNLKALKKDVRLRTPFGDIWKVFPGNLSFQRTSGVGMREFGVITVPYSQVA